MLPSDMPVHLATLDEVVLDAERMSRDFLFWAFSYITTLSAFDSFRVT